MTIEERLVVLEKELNKSKRRTHYLLGTLILIVTIGIMGATSLKSGNVIRANRFILEDQNGNVRGVLSVNDNDPALHLLDENGKVRVALGITKYGPTLGLCDENGTARSTLSAVEGGQGVGLFDEKDTLRAMLGISKGKPGCCLYDVNGNSIWGSCSYQPHHNAQEGVKN